ncbi:MAG TPA: hypothetical protein DCZ95_11370 [Verrucomicrobia bacterium]|nr:MAG: hypothetical protein A2X46_04230 [Lentisphaerae bacterium GWF2_57_35]HBA84684.1 hypothetical protein [Verrucomicrobiota bacterium]
MTETDHSICPSCGKPNPADAKICRFCTAGMKKRVSVVAFFGVGIFLLLIVAIAHFSAAIRYRPNYIAIHHLTAARNFDRVRVLGRVENVSVTRGPYGSKKVRIGLAAANASDRSPEHRISVRLEGEPALEFLAKENAIARGDLIEVAASLYAGENYRHLSVGGAQFIQLKEKGTEEASRPETPRADDSNRVSVRELLEQPGAYSNRVVFVPKALVLNVSTSWPSFQIADPGETNRSLIVFGYEPNNLRPGLMVSIRGRFEFYAKKGYWEITTRRGDRRAVWVHKEKTSE